MDMVDCKPIVTCHGDQEVFASVRGELTERLPRDSVEWRRSYGRPPKTVQVEASFITFSQDVLPKEKDRTLLRQPFFHIYWTECPDAETYRAEVKDDIGAWLQVLKQLNIPDWFIIVVETDKIKKGNKPKLLPRTSVIDKIRSDFCSKQSSDRCAVLFESNSPPSAQRSVDSWQMLIAKLRPLMLSALNRNLSRYEEMMRSQREKRTDPRWNFSDYFMLQEELAFVFEMLKLPEESLVQYDELDALFSQFVINTQAGESPRWLASFTSDCNCWDGLNLSQAVNQEKRQLVRKGKATLLDLRNYLFSRQCALLFELQRPWEVAQRSLPFMHNTVHELQILELPLPVGSVACWVFLSCLEVLQMCERYGTSSQVDAYTHYTASLWAYAREKLHELGLLCGLLPDMTPSSEQLHLVVDLLSGMGKLESQAQEDSPNQKLREALSSQEAFQKHYLELSELAMGTYKHIGRLRCAKRIGKELAAFYMKKKEPQKAEIFLSDALKTFVEEGWDLLVTYTRKELALCQKEVTNSIKYLKNCALLASDSLLSIQDRNHFCDELIQVSEQLSEEPEGDKDEEILMKMDPVFKFKDIEMKPANGKVIIGQEVTLTVTLESNLTKEITCNKMCISFSHSSCDYDSQSEDRVSHDSVDQSQTSSQQYEYSNSKFPSSLDFRYECDYQADKTVQWSGVVCKNINMLLQRQDSTSSLRRVEVWQKEDFSLACSVQNVVLHPGNNVIVFQTEVTERGTYTVNQMCAEINDFQFLHPRILPALSHEVTTQEPVISITPLHEPLYIGVPQWLSVHLSTNCFIVKSGNSINMKAPDGMSILEVSGDVFKLHPHENGAILDLPEIEANSEADVEIKVLTEVPCHTEDTDEELSVRKELQLACPWADQVFCTLNFTLPFTVKHKLHTAGERKFIHVQINGTSDLEFALRDSCLRFKSMGDESYSEVSGIHSNAEMQLARNLTASYVWLMNNKMLNAESIDVDFTVSYKPVNAKIDDAWHKCKHSFTLENFQTQYKVTAQVQPQSTDFCKAGTLCNLNIHVDQLQESTSDDEENVNGNDTSTSILYEVTANSNLWALCGKSSGVFSLPTEAKSSHTVTLEVMPLIAGFLPIPSVKLSKYLASKLNTSADAEQQNDEKCESITCTTTDICTDEGPHLQPFSSGQVYIQSQVNQVHVIPDTNTSTLEVSVP